MHQPQEPFDFHPAIDRLAKLIILLERLAWFESEFDQQPPNQREFGFRIRREPEFIALLVTKIAILFQAPLALVTQITVAPEERRQLRCSRP